MKTFYQYLQEQNPNQAQQPMIQTQPNQQVKPGTQTQPNQQVKPGTQTQPNQQVKPGTQPNQPQVDIKKLTDTFNALKQLLSPLGIK